MTDDEELKRHNGRFNGSKEREIEVDIRHEGQRIATFNPGQENIVEICDANAGRVLMHCDKNQIWYLHVGDKEIPLDELMGNLALIKRVVNELADNARLSSG